MKKWLTIDELVELRLPNLPNERSAMSRRATKEGWPRRKRSTGNRGVTYEYELDKSGIEQPTVLRTETPSMTNTPLNSLCEQLEVLTEEEIQDLVQMVKRKGAETLLYLLDDDNINLLKLDRVIKDKVLGKHYPEDDEQVALNDTSGRECGPDGKDPVQTLYTILCKCLFSEVTVQAVTELDNKAAHCNAPVPQRHCPFL